MTVTPREYGAILFGAFYYNDRGADDASSGMAYIHGGETVSIPVILYKGRAIIEPDLSHGNPILNIAGDITTDGDGTYFVTGDCLIDVI